MDEDLDWPPGTVRLAQSTGADPDEAEIVLQPRPTADPNDPLNWPRPQKIFNYLMGSFYAMIVYASVNATAPKWGPLADELGFSSTLLTQTYAIGRAGLAIGAPMLIPFALKYGSRAMYLCWLGALCEVLVNITISDVFFVHQRGLMNSIYVWVMNIGGNLSLVPAGFATDSMGWRWVWWWFSIFFGIQFLLFFFGFEETRYKAPIEKPSEDRDVVTATESLGIIPTGEEIAPIDEKRPADVQFAIDVEYGTSTVVATTTQRTPIDTRFPRKTYFQKLSLFTVAEGSWVHYLRHSWQPFMIMVTIPGAAFSCACYAILLANNTTQTAALSQYMIEPPYNFNSAQIGLMNLAPFIGNTLGCLICGPVSDWVVVRLARRNGGIYEPEMRFWVFLPFVPFYVAGSWWFGFALADGRAWWTVALSYGICNFGLGPLQSLILTFLLDSYGCIVADALTALTFVRNLFSTIFVFALPAWIDAVGIANVFSTISAISIVILSFATVFIWKGKQMRNKTAKIYRHYADRQFER